MAHGGRSVTELDAGGNIVAKHALELPQRELVSRLRTFKGKDGKRLYLGITPGMQQVHLFDENWKRIMSFPEDAYKNPHAGVGDAWIADMDGDGSGEIVAGYLGLVGVKSIASDGKTLWSNRSIANVFNMAVGGPDQSGRRPLYCVNDRTTLAVIDSPRKNGNANCRSTGGCFLQSPPKISMPIHKWNSADSRLQAWAKTWPWDSIHKETCFGATRCPRAPLPRRLSEFAARGFPAKGAGQWVLLGPDGSVHIVGIDGKPVEEFNYGAAVTGLATTSFSGRPVLLFGSRKGVEALAVEWPGR